MPDFVTRDGGHPTQRLSRLSARLYLLRRRWFFTRKIHREVGYSLTDSWRLAGLNQRIALEITAEMRAADLARAEFEASVLADLNQLEVTTA